MSRDATDPIELTDAQWGVMRHALGLDRADKPYRNGYMAPVGHHSRGECEALESLGLMSNGGRFFYVTSRGFQVMFGTEWRAMKARAEA